MASMEPFVFTTLDQLQGFENDLIIEIEFQELLYILAPPAQGSASGAQDSAPGGKQFRSQMAIGEDYDDGVYEEDPEVEREDEDQKINQWIDDESKAPIGNELLELTQKQLFAIVPWPKTKADGKPKTNKALTAREMIQIIYDSYAAQHAGWKGTPVRELGERTQDKLAKRSKKTKREDTPPAEPVYYVPSDEDDEVDWDDEEVKDDADKYDLVERFRCMALDMKKLQLDDSTLHDIWSAFDDDAARRLHQMPSDYGPWSERIKSMDEKSVLEYFTNYDLPPAVFWLVWQQKVGIKFPNIFLQRNSVIAGNFLCAQYYRSDLSLNSELYEPPKPGEVSRRHVLGCPICTNADKEDSIRCDNCMACWHRWHREVRISKPPSEENRRMWVCPTCMVECIGVGPPPKPHYCMHRYNSFKTKQEMFAPGAYADASFSP